jgi:hypothetical protein
MSARPNAELAYRVLDHIDAHPEQWNQKRWWCGTSGCFAGWAVTLSGEQVNADACVTANGLIMHVSDRAAQVLGFPDEDALIDAAIEAMGGGIPEEDDAPALFNAGNTREDLGRLVAEIFGPRPGGAQ